MANAQVETQFVRNKFGGQSLVIGGYRFMIKNRRQERIYWSCSVSACGAKATTFDGILTRNTDNHTHAADQTDVDVRTVMANIRKRCREELTPIPSIYEEQIATLRGKDWDEHQESTARAIPTFQTCKTSLYLERSKLHPNLPTSAADIVLEDDWTKTTSGADFLQVASRNGVLRVFPDTSVKACFFHYTQCIWRKVQATGLTTAYKDNECFHRLARRASVLPLVPEEDVEDVWFEALEDVGAEDVPVDVTPFTDYVTEQWVEGDKDIWNHFATEGPRTTNHLEGWHNKLKKAVRHAHPNIFSIIETLQQIEAAGHVRMLQYEAGGVRPVKRRRYRLIEHGLNALKMHLENGEVTTMEYADAASQLLHI